MPVEISNPWLPDELASTTRQLHPYPWFREMRAEQPVRYDRERGTVDVFLHEDVSTVLTDYETFTRRDTSYIDGHMASREPPIHTDLRGGLAKRFRANYLDQMQPQIERLARELLDDALADGNDLEFVEAVAKPLPILIIAEMLGVPSDRTETFRAWSTTLAESPREPTAEAVRDLDHRQDRALEELGDFFANELEKREAEPTDDMVSRVLEVERDSELVERRHSIAQCAHLLVAGNVTTTEFLASAMWTFAEEDLFPELGDGTVDLENALEEVLRYRPPVMTGKRYTTRDTTIRGVEVPAGTRVIGWLGSANRDEAVFEDPESFDPTRDTTGRSLPFGKGIHHCLGAPLARLEGAVLFTEIVDRIETAELRTEAVEPFYSPEVFGPAELPIGVTR